MSVICGEIGIDPTTFKRMTFREVICIIKGYRKRQVLDFQQTWEQARWISYISVQPYTSKIKRPGQLIKFPWEKKKISTQAVNNDLAIRALLEKK